MGRSVGYLPCMDVRIAPHEAAAALRAALAAGYAGPEDTSLVLYDMDRVLARLDEARHAFPDGTLHAVAVKANPLPAVLARLAEAGPHAGAEAASLPELELALAAGFEPERVVFDSPAKTEPELRLALSRGVAVNADNFQELVRIAAIVEQDGAPRAPVGLRVNPQVGAGSIADTSVAAEYSKFGVPLDACRDALLEAYARHPWLTALHCHVGSQGCPVDMLVEAARVMVRLAGDIRAAGGRVDVLDLGGGMPVTYLGDDPKPAIADYAAALRAGCPEALDGSHRLVTEFGRAVHANAAFAASRVEYVKQQPGHRTAVTHLGADMFLRPCYLPGVWKHELLVATPEGSLKDAPEEPVHIAGPLCFQGDFIAREAMLPRIDPGDWLLVRDAGAYTLSMWSRYNSRQMPTVLGYDGDLDFTTLKLRETTTDLLRFWE